LNVDARIRRLQVLVAVTILILIVVTWPLWRTPQDFPAVPMFAFALDAPLWLDGCALVGLWCGLVLVLMSVLAIARRVAWCPTSQATGLVWSHLRKAGWILFLGAALYLIVLDQHRCQPWLWQAMLLAVLFSTQDRQKTLHGARLIAIAIYAHSAVSKIDFSFLLYHGPALIDGLLANVKATLPADRTCRMVCAALLPAGEMMAAGLLTLSRSRRIGLWLSAGMHLGLIAALGPGGLNHKPGVLIWNAYFVVQNALLFGCPSNDVAQLAADQSAQGETSGVTSVWSALSWQQRSKQSAMGMVFALAAILPIAEWFDRLDPWLGWSVYASRPPRLQLFVDELSVERLPEELQSFVEPPAPLDRWRRVRIDRWSLAATSAPISPHVRFQLGIAIDVAERAGLQDDVKVVVESSADRRTGRRSMREFVGRNALREFSATFHFNAMPREFPGSKPIGHETDR
jgi:hypothetical protein